PSARQLLLSESRLHSLSVQHVLWTVSLHLPARFSAVPTLRTFLPSPQRGEGRRRITMQPILIVDYGMANLRSVQKAFEKVGFAADVSGDPNRVAECDRLVLPGVGAFRDAIARLNESGLAAPIKEHVRSGKKFLGICL